MTTPALEVRDLSKAFRAVQALDSVSIELHRGRVTALLGDNGAGKSTLVKCIAGIYQPDSGTISIDGRNTGSPRPTWPGRWASSPSTRTCPSSTR